MDDNSITFSKCWNGPAISIDNHSLKRIGAVTYKNIKQSKRGQEVQWRADLEEG